MKKLLATTAFGLIAAANAVAVSWTQPPPSSVLSGQSYGVGAVHSTGSTTVLVYIFKNGTMVASATGTYAANATYNCQGDAYTGQPITYRAEGWNYNPGNGLSSSIAAYTTIIAPNPTVTGITTDIGTVIRPGNIFKPRVSATANSNLASIHIFNGPPDADYNSLTNAQAFVGTSGTSATADGNPITAGSPGTTYTFYARCETSSPTAYSPAYGPITFTVTNSPPDCSLDTLNYGNGTITGNGWAADPETGTPVNRVELYLDGVYKGNATLGGDRQDVAAAYGRSDYRYSGYNFSFSSAGVAPGTHTVLAKAFDNWGASADRTNTVNITNTAPTVAMTINGITSPGGTTNALTVSNGTTITISTSASDVDGNLQRIRVWTNFNSQGWTEIRNVTSSSDSFGYTLTGVGTYEVHCRSMDSQSLESSTAVINVTSANRAPDLPTISSGGVSSIALGASVSLTGTLRDLDGNLAYHGLWYLPPGGSWTLVPGAPTAPSNGTNSTVTGSFAPTSLGTWQFKTTGHDGSLWGPDAILSVSVYDGTAPSVPGGLNPSAITSTSFTLSWNPSSDNVGVTGYEVMRDTTSLGPVPGTSISVVGLAVGTSYSMTVRARDAAGNWSDWSSALSVLTLPGAPTANAATSVTSNSFAANWTSVPSATSYRLDVATDSGFTSLVAGYQDLNVGNVITYPVSGLAPSSPYYFRVRAVNASGAGANSNAPSVTTLVGAPGQPTATAATAITASSFNANWNVVGGATSYRLDVSTVNTFASYVTGYQDKDVGNAAPSSVSGLAAYTDYYYRVRAVNAGGSSPSSNVIGTKTVVSAPTATAATTITSSSFSANWTSVTGATGYRLDVSTSSVFSSYVPGYQDIDVGAVTSSPVTGLTGSTDHYYRVRAVGSSGTSTNSNNILVTTLLAPPAAPVATAATGITGTGFNANWSAVAGATEYRLDVSTSSSFSSYVTGYQDKNVGTSTTSAVSGLSQGITYYYRVRGANSAGTSPNSNIISVITIPSAPVASAATGITSSGFTANWSAVSGASSYRLDVSTVNTFSSFVDGYQDKNVGAVTNSGVTGLAGNTNYYYRVRAVNASGTGPSSNVINPLTIPSDPNAIAPNGLTYGVNQQLGINPNTPFQSDSSNTSQLKVHKPQ